MPTPVNVGLTTLILAANDAAVAAAADCLVAGGLVAFPTETVYGLGTDASNPAAVARLYLAKGRPSFNPLIAHVSDLKAAQRIARFDATAIALADAFWPGPLTLVLPKTGDCSVADLATAGLDTIAIRVPAHPVARAILSAFGGPVVAPSANLSGHVSPTSAAPWRGPRPMPTMMTASRWRRACWPRTTRRARPCDSMRFELRRAKRCWRSARMQCRALTRQPR